MEKNNLKWLLGLLSGVSLLSFLFFPLATVNLLWKKDYVAGYEILKNLNDDNKIFLFQILAPLFAIIVSLLKYDDKNKEKEANGLLIAGMLMFYSNFSWGDFLDQTSSNGFVSLGIGFWLYLICSIAAGVVGVMFYFRWSKENDKALGLTDEDKKKRNRNYVIVCSIIAVFVLVWLLCFGGH